MVLPFFALYEAPGKNLSAEEINEMKDRNNT